MWEPSGHRLLEAIGTGRDRGLDVGCGVLGWLRLLSRWVGPDGEVVGTDIDEAMLAAAAQFVADEQLPNVALMKDDLFATSLEPASFDLVHARFELTPLGRVEEQLATYLRLTRPGGIVVLEDPDWGSWHFNPPAPALEELISRSLRGLPAMGGCRGRTQTAAVVPTLRHRGERPAEVLALPPGHPYLRLPLQFTTALEARLLSFVDATELARLRTQAEAELKEPERWGTTFTLLQSWGRVA